MVSGHVSFCVAFEKVRGLKPQACFFLPQIYKNINQLKFLFFLPQIYV